MARCRVVIRQQPALAGCTVIVEPWPMRVVGVVDSPLYGCPAVILEWYSAEPRGYQWEPGYEPMGFRTLAEWQARIAEDAAERARVLAAPTEPPRVWESDWVEFL